MEEALDLSFDRLLMMMMTYICVCVCMCVPGYLSRYSDSLPAVRSGDRIPVWVRFSSRVQTDPGVHPASYTIGTGSFPGVKLPGRGVNHTSPPSAEVKGREELYLCHLPGPSWPVLGSILPTEALSKS